MCNSKTSVIIPSYNSEKTIAKCVKSVLMQTYQNLEIIVVNDGSKDNTLSVLETLAFKDKRIKILDQTNEGEEAARDNGYKLAQGEYISFVDSDDWLPHDAIENLVLAAEEKNADVVVGKTVRVFDGRGYIRKTGTYKLAAQNNLYDYREFNHEEFMQELYISHFGINILPVSVWGRVYRKNLIDSADIIKLSLKIGSDLVFNLQCLPFAHKIITIPNYVYFYRYGGITSKLNRSLFDDAIEAYKLKKRMIEKHNFEKANQFIAIELKNFLIGYIKSLLIHSDNTKEEIISIIEREMGRPEMREAIFIPTRDKFTSDELVTCIKRMDAEKFFTIIERSAKKEKVKRRILSLTSDMLRWISPGVG